MLLGLGELSVVLLFLVKLKELEGNFGLSFRLLGLEVLFSCCSPSFNREKWLLVALF